MRKNLYYRTVVGRPNVLKTVFLDFFKSVASYPRMLLEVFLRRDMGERFFSRATFITVAIFLCLFPIIVFFVAGAVFSYYGSGFQWGKFAGLLVGTYSTWIVFTVLFIRNGIRRYREITQSVSSFDFGRFSKSPGLIDDRFYKFTFRGKKFTVRQIETILEPGFFFLVGLGLTVLFQPLGTLLMVSSVFYCLYYVATYYEGDNFILDKIDEMIMNEEMESAFVNDESPEKTRGVKFYMKRPVSKSDREQLANSMVVQQEYENVVE